MCSHDGEFAIKVILRGTGLGEFVIHRSLAHRVNLQTYLLLPSLGGAFAAFAQFSKAWNRPGPLVGKKGQNRRAKRMEASRGSIARPVAERGPIPHYRHYNSLAVCSRFLAPFAHNGKPVHRRTLFNAHCGIFVSLLNC